MTGLCHHLATTDRLGNLEPLGVVDIGSNSVRFVIYDGLTRAPTPVFNEKVLCGLGKSVASTGHLGDKSVSCAISALGRFHAIARNLGVKTIKAIATAAVREAVDGADFIARGQRELGARIESCRARKRQSSPLTGS